MPIYKVNGKKKDGLQKYQVKINYTDQHGARKQIMRTAYGMQAARDLEHELTESALTTPDMSVETTSMTVGELYEDYLKHISHEIRESSVVKKNCMFNGHILPYLKDVSIDGLTIQLLQDWKSYVYSKKLSLNSMKNIYKDFNAVLNYAVKMEYISINPLVKVGGFKDAYRYKPEMDFYTPEEFQIYKYALLERAIMSDNYDYYVFFCIAYYTGARKGEIHALTWNDYDGKNIFIKKSISQKIRGKDVLTPPKNKSSIRTISVPIPLQEMINEHKIRQQALIPDWKDDGYICGYYRPLRDTGIDNENRATAKRAGLKRIRIHDFRHSHASVLINGNISPLEVSHRLGHSSTEQTLATYSHLFPSESEKSLNLLNKI